MGCWRRRRRARFCCCTRRSRCRATTGCGGTERPVYDKSGSPGGHTYEAMAAHHKVNLVVLCISPQGTILPQSLRFAPRLAKMANMSFNEFWAPVITEVIRGTTRSVIETQHDGTAAHQRARRGLRCCPPSTSRVLSVVPVLDRRCPLMKK